MLREMFEEAREAKDDNIEISEYDEEEIND
jgi:hypothetical protein